ncbi:MAG: hypothetical protein U9R25_18910 [Chloroflexota bacterium]|nr:hypothetical protein [Chloroflexota bacterium]
MNEDTPILFTVWETPVRAQSGFAAALAAVWALMTWLAGRGNPGRPLPLRLLVGFISMLAVVSADVSHAMAHIISARAAYAPVDEILLSHGMPRTIYFDNDITPQQHRMRALGGPVYSGLACLLVLALRRLAPEDTIFHEVLGYTALAHGLISAGSMAPLEMVDGGSILKWSLVEQGKTEEEADHAVQQVAKGSGTALTATGLVIAGSPHRLVGFVLAAGGLITIIGSQWQSR